MTKFNIAEAKAHFSELVQKAMLGEEVVISKDNTPVAKLIPFAPSGRPRKPGSAKGRVRMAPDFEATPEDFREFV